jgi:hypothetical protein
MNRLNASILPQCFKESVDVFKNVVCRIINMDVGDFIGLDLFKESHDDDSGVDLVMRDDGFLRLKVPKIFMTSTNVLFRAKPQ